MQERRFEPGFRISGFDRAILFGGVVGMIAGAMWDWRCGFFVGFAVGHFFLFCNVFRIRRAPELVWAGTFIALSACNLFTGVPGWPGTILGALALTVFLIGRELKMPWYHGVGWKRVNPGLRGWWEREEKYKG